MAKKNLNKILGVITSVAVFLAGVFLWLEQMQSDIVSYSGLILTFAGMLMLLTELTR